MQAHVDESSPQTDSRRQLYLTAAALVVLTLLAYAPGFDNGYIWDDDDYVTENQTLRTADGLIAMWTQPGAIPQYYPLVHTTFWIEYQLWGLAPAGYHIVNVLLHILAASFLWRVLAILKLPGAGFAAILFAIHPVNVESVAWITERKNVLSAFFFFAALTQLLQWEVQRPKPWRWCLAFGLFIAALLSKTITCSLPAVFLVILWWQKGRLKKADSLPITPFFALGLALAWITIRMEKIGVGATGSEWDFGFAERLLIAGRAIWFYAGKVIWPAENIFIYPRWQIDAAQGWQWFWPSLTVLVLLLALVWQKRIGRGPLAVALLYIGTLFPALGFFDVYPMRYSFVADHFQYLSLAAGVAALSAGLMRGVAGLPSPLSRVATFLIPTAIAIVFLFLSRAHVRHFADAETLWVDTLNKNPAAWIAHNNLGIIRLHQDATMVAIDHFETVLRLKPDHANACANLGLSHAKLGDLSAAESWFNKALQLAPKDSRMPMLYGNFLATNGRREAAKVQLERALAIKPNNLDARVNLGNLYAEQEAFEQARTQYEQVLAIAPHHVDARFNLGLMEHRRGNRELALSSFAEVLSRRPNHPGALWHTGVYLLRADKNPAAVGHFERLLAVSPRHAGAHFYRGYLYHRVGELDKALYHYLEASRHQADFVDAFYHQGLVYVASKRLPEAREAFRRVLALAPKHPQATAELNKLTRTPERP